MTDDWRRDDWRNDRIGSALRGKKGKQVLERARDFGTTRTRDEWLRTPRIIGNFRRTVGILSASLTGRRVIELLRPHDLDVLLHDPYLTDATVAGRVRAVIDVTDPEVLPPEHPLWDCDNVLLAPHPAGSQGNEWRRLADLALAETARWAAGAGFLHPVRRERLAFQA